MKKILLISVFLFLISISFNIKKVNASESYTTFQEIELKSGHMLKEYGESYKDYYSKINKRKFWGWRVYLLNDNVPAKFVSETVFSYYNNGSTPITYEYELSRTVVNKVSVSAKDNLKMDVSGSYNKIKFGLENELQISGSAEGSVTTKEEKTLEVIVDPQSVASLRVVGEGRVINGVAAFYTLWIRLNRGGFEYFVVTTQYPRLEVLPL